MYLEELAGEPPPRLSAANLLMMLTQRIGKSANEVVGAEGLSPEALYLLGKDVKVFRELALGMKDGNADLRLLPSESIAAKERLTRVLERFERMADHTNRVLSDLKNLVMAREAVKQLLLDAVALERVLCPLCFIGE